MKTILPLALKNSQFNWEGEIAVLYWRSGKILSRKERKKLYLKVLVSL
jgi:hypothetical protein